MTSRSQKKKPTTKLSPVVSLYFEAWIGLDTWDSHHWLDEERFYRFVKAMARYNRPAPVPTAIRALIVQRWRGHRDDEELREEAEYFAGLYQTLLGYEKARGFPDPLIERSNILLYYLHLTWKSRNNEQQIKRMMANTWGKDWQAKLSKARRVR